MKTLIGIQDDAIADILNAKTYARSRFHSSGTFLNRKRMVMRGIRRRFLKASAKLGYNEAQTEDQWRAVKDMALLQASAEESEGGES